MGPGLGDGVCTGAAAGLGDGVCTGAAEVGPGLGDVVWTGAAAGLGDGVCTGAAAGLGDGVCTGAAEVGPGLGDVVWTGAAAGLGDGVCTGAAADTVHPGVGRSVSMFDVGSPFWAGVGLVAVPGLTESGVDGPGSLGTLRLRFMLDDAPPETQAHGSLVGPSPRVLGVGFGF